MVCPNRDIFKNFLLGSAGKTVYDCPKYTKKYNEKTISADYNEEFCKNNNKHNKVECSCFQLK